MIANQEQLVAAIAKEVLARLEERLGSLPAAGKNAPGDDGVFRAVDEAV
jgi:hypothetical protein